jgi:hypothetical protein
MRKLILCSALSLIGLFAGVASSQSDPSPEATAKPATSDSDTSSGVGLCCIEYTCPSPDFSTEGCKSGSGPSIREAYDACNNACNVQCASSGLYCEP